MPRRTIWLAVLIFSGGLRPPLGWADDTPPAPRYAEAVRNLQPFIEREVADKGLPALSVALVDGPTVVWARGFGFEDPQARTPATADTVYRVGSVSKLFTEIGRAHV